MGKASPTRAPPPTPPTPLTDTRCKHYSALTETGMSRLALSDADKQARDWFVDTTRALGCDVVVDAMGNTFAVRPGRIKGAKPIYAGSHLDTQPAAGRYDGILGIHAGVEMLNLLRDHDIETEHPIGVVNWTKCVHRHRAPPFPSYLLQKEMKKKKGIQKPLFGTALTVSVLSGL